MANNKDEWISALADGEVHGAELDQWIQSLRDDDQLKQRWESYHLIRDALHKNLSHRPIPDFSQRVSAALDNEPVVLAPRSSLVHLPHKWIKQSVGVAVAASVAAVAIMTVQNLNQEEMPVQTAQAPSTQEYVRLAQQPAAKPARAQVKQFESYLVKHNAYSPVSRTHDVMPYARIVSHEVTR